MLIDITLTQWGQYNKYIEDDGGDTPGGSFTSKDDWDENLIEVQAQMVSITRNCDENTAPGDASAAAASAAAAAAEAPTAASTAETASAPAEAAPATSAAGAAVDDVNTGGVSGSGKVFEYDKKGPNGIYYKSSQGNLKNAYCTVVNQILEGNITQDKIQGKNLDLNGLYVHNNKIILPYCVFDTEISETQALFGFYFPYTKTYHSILLENTMEVDVFHALRMEIIDFFMACFTLTDIYETFPELKKAANLESEELAEIAAASIKKKPEHGGGGVVPSYLNLNSKHPIFLKYNNKINTLIAPIFLTFNGEVFDNRMLNVLFYYQNKNYTNKYNDFKTIQKTIATENPKLCISELYKVCKDIINGVYDKKFTPGPSKMYTDQLPYTLAKYYMHFDVYNFLLSKQKNGPLSLHKNEIYLKNIVKDGNFPNFIPLEFIDLAKEIDYSTFSNIEYVKLYNFNDTFYTYMCFLSNDGLEVVKSRLMFFEIYPFNPNNDKNLYMPMTLNKKDSALGVDYITKEITPYISVTSKNEIIHEKRMLFFDDLILLSEYPMGKPIYENIFKGLNYLDNNGLDKINNRVIKIKNCEVKLGIGGIHSGALSEESNQPVFEETDDINKYQSSTSNDLTKSIIAISDEDFVIIDLDVKSFYVELIIQIFYKANEFKKTNFFTSLKEMRNKLKKDKNPLQLIYKIIILSVTGQFNAEFSPVYDPLMYFSMTINGQLIILEFLLSLEKEGLLNRIISANTDGVTLEIKREHLTNFQNFVSNFQKEYAIEFDTFDLIKSIITFNVNKYIVIYEDSTKEPKLKGFQKGNFDIYTEFLINCAKNIKKDVVGDINFIFNMFNFTYEQIYNEPGFSYKFMGYSSGGGEKKVYFLSQNPDSFIGIRVGKRSYHSNELKVLPIKEFSLLKNAADNFKVGKQFEINPLDMLTKLKNTLSKAAYFKMIFNNLVDTKLLSHTNSQGGNLSAKKAFMQFFNTKIREFNPINLTIYKDMLEKTYPVFKSIKYLQNMGIKVIPKTHGKKSFKGFNETVGDIDKFYNEIYISACAVSANLETSFPNIVVLDVDDPGIFFNPGELKISHDLLDFLELLVWRDCVIVSSPTAENIERFKIVFKIKNSKFKNYKEFKQELEPIIENSGLPFKLETRASLVGCNVIPWDLKPFYNIILRNKELPEISFEDLVSLFNISDGFVDKTYKFQKNLLKMRGYPPDKFKKIYLEFSTKQGNSNLVKHSTNYNALFIEEILNGLTEEYASKNLLFLDLIVHNHMVDKHLIDIQNLTYSVMCNFTLASPTVNTAFKQSIDKKAYPTNNTTFKKSKTNKAQDKVKAISQDDIINFKMGLTRHIETTSRVMAFSSNPSLTPKSLNKFCLSETLCLLINSLVSDINNKHGLTFKLQYIEFENKSKLDLDGSNISELSVDVIPTEYQNTVIGSIVYTSECIYKSDPNKRVVGLTFTRSQAYVKCFHASCQKNKLYDFIENSAMAQYTINYLLNDKGPFIEIEESLMNYLAPNFREESDDEPTSTDSNHGEF